MFLVVLCPSSERYRYLTCPSAQLKFLGLQKELLDDFRIRLTQVIIHVSARPSVMSCNISFTSVVLHAIFEEQQSLIALSLEDPLCCSLALSFTFDTNRKKSGI